MTTVGEALIKLLEGYGVETVFGLPGVHTIDLYRGLASSNIRHVTPRHEQAVGFMADGYARASGRPGVAFTITGPGLLNALTAIGQAYCDSIPILVVSSANNTFTLGLGHGELHEVADQRAMAAGVTGFSHLLLSPEGLSPILARAFSSFSAARPRPVSISIPQDVVTRDIGNAAIKVWPRLAPPSPSRQALAEAVAALEAGEKIVILAGGGAVNAAGPLQALAERLAAPVMLTNNARGLLPADHPLLVDGLQSFPAGRKLVAEADVVLAIGTELGETDYDFYAADRISFPGHLIRIDIDPEQIGGLHRPDTGIVSDAGEAIAAILDAISRAGDPARLAAAKKRAALANREGRKGWTQAQDLMSDFADCIRDALGDPILVGDSTQPVYQAALTYRAHSPRSWFSASTGFGTLGYALPAAIGAKLACPDRPVVALVGDGGLQFSLSEMRTAVEERVPVKIVIWNNESYREIREAMEKKQVAPVGTEVTPPDLMLLAKAMGMTGMRAASFKELAAALSDHDESKGPCLIEVTPELTR